MTQQSRHRFERFLEDFEAIVNIDSSSANPEGVHRVAEFLQARLDALGLETNLDHLGQDGVPCLKACTPSRNGRYDFLLLGHMDTVFPPGEAAKRPFRIQDGRAFGPGVNDMKGGLLLAVNALETLNEQDALKDLAICLAFNGDEETGSTASRPWIEDMAAHCDHVLVFEACHPGYHYVTRRKGSIRVKVVAHGQSAHAGGVPQKGVNAVLELAHQVCRIHELNHSNSGITAQCTIFHGGDCLNVVPDRAETEVDVRVGTREESERVKAFFEALPKTAIHPDASIEIIFDEQRPPMEYSPASEALWEIVRKQAQKLDLAPEAIGSGGCSDGNWTAAMGIPTLDGMGPVGANSHREDEYMELDSILPTLAVAVKTMKQFIDSGQLGHEASVASRRDTGLDK